MRFNEKLVILRNNSGLLQEEIAEKLNVTKETVIEWEQGKILPEMDKMYEMSKLFNITVDSLINEDIEDKNDASANNRVIKTIVTIIWLGILVLVIHFEISLYKKTSVGTPGIFNQIEIVMNQFDSLAFNCTLEQYTGTFSDIPVRKVLEKICKINKRNKKCIVVIFKGKEYVDIDKIAAIQSNLSGERYHISFEHDEEGYINKAIIDQIYSDKAKIEINGYLAGYPGELHGRICELVLNQVIANNSYSDKKITVLFDGITTDDATKIDSMIKQIKKQGGVYTIRQTLDKEGYIKRITITEERR